MINIDTVYQRVLALTNKEQRGYVTPLEFNLLANQAQFDIFEQYFYDINQLALTNDIGLEYSNSVDTIKEKISFFESINTPITGGSLPANLYRLSTVIHNNENEVEYVERDRLLYILKSPLTRPTTNRPLYTRVGNLITVYGNNGNLITTNISCNYIRRPSPVEWGYNVIVEKALYNAGSSTNFELHQSEETKLVIKILELAGIVINKPGLVTIASQKEASKIQQEKA